MFLYLTRCLPATAISFIKRDKELYGERKQADSTLTLYCAMQLMDKEVSNTKEPSSMNKMRLGD